MVQWKSVTKIWTLSCIYLKGILLNVDFVGGALEDYEDSAPDSAGLQHHWQNESWYVMYFKFLHFKPWIKYNFKEKDYKHGSSLIEKVSRRRQYLVLISKSARSLVFDDQIMI